MTDIRNWWDSNGQKEHSTAGQIFPFYNTVPRKPLTDKMVVLDIDETLVHTFTNFNEWVNLKIMTDPKKMDLRSRNYVVNVEADKSGGTSEKMWGVKRPHLEEFLKFCFNYFKYVVVWSAGTYDYVHAIVDEIFGSTYAPHAVLTRGDCVGPIGNLEKPFWNMLKIVPALKDHTQTDPGEIYNNIKNVFIIDDRRKSFAQNPNNGILIPVYEPSPNVDGLRRDDVAFLQIMNWLMRPDVMKSIDVRKLDKSSMFNTSVPGTMSSGLGVGLGTVAPEIKVDIKNKNMVGTRGLITVNS